MRIWTAEEVATLCRSAATPVVQPRRDIPGSDQERQAVAGERDSPSQNYRREWDDSGAGGSTLAQVVEPLAAS
jgi:hypothetical protein